MKQPIPNDWSGDNWLCVRVEWPDSPMWIAVLSGLLTQVMRGRMWDERTGSILDTQAIGAQIYDRNFPFNLCLSRDGDNSDPGGSGGDTGAIYPGGFETLECEGDCMSGCSIPYGSLRWFEGKLQYLYCGNWYDVGGDSSTPIIPTDPDVGVIPDPPPTGWEDSTACAKARALAVLTYNIVVQSFAQFEGVTDPWEFYNDLSDEFRTIDLAFDDVMNIYFNLIPVNVAGLEGETKDIGVVDWLKCGFVSFLAETNGGITADEYDDLRGAISGILKNAIPPAYEGFESAMREIWRRAFFSIGAKDAAKVTYYAQPLETDNCDCPGTTPQSDYDGAVTFTGTYSNGTATGCTINSYTVLDGGRVARLDISAADGNFREIQNFVFDMDGIQASDEIWIDITPYGPGGGGAEEQWNNQEVPTSNWEEFDPVTWSNLWFQPIQHNGNATRTFAGFPLRWQLRMVVDAGSSAVDGIYSSLRWAPETGGFAFGTSKNYKVQLAIVKVNDDDYSDRIVEE